MTKEEFLKQLEFAKAAVEKMPPWMRTVLEDSLSPTVPVPREPVDNRCKCCSCDDY